MTQYWTLDDENKVNMFVEYVSDKIIEGKPQTVQFISPGRTNAQNAMMFGLYQDIAKQKDDQSILDIRKECKLHFGVPILRANNAEFCEWYDDNIKSWPYEAKLILMEHLDVTSDFNKEQASVYISEILRHYQKEGCYLPDPRQMS